MFICVLFLRDLICRFNQNLGKGFFHYPSDWPSVEVGWKRAVFPQLPLQYQPPKKTPVLDGVHCQLSLGLFSTPLIVHPHSSISARRLSKCLLERRDGEREDKSGKERKEERREGEGETKEKRKVRRREDTHGPLL